MFKFVKVFLAVLLIAACSKQDDAAKEANMIISTANGDVKYVVEEAQTPDELQKGLMFRDSVAENGGMIFDLTNVQNVAMWMKNTKVPLDMIFLDSDGTISWIFENAVPMSEDYIIPPIAPAAVIEVNGGDVQKHGIKIGDVVKHKFLNNVAETAPAAPVAESEETPAPAAAEETSVQEPVAEVPAPETTETPAN